MYTVNYSYYLVLTEAKAKQSLKSIEECKYVPVIIFNCAQIYQKT